MRRRWQPFHEIDLAEAGVLPPQWQRQIQSVVREFGMNTVLTGAGSTSRESKRNQRMRVRVADGAVVKHHLEWLWQLYDGFLREFAAACLNRRLFVAHRLPATVNINELRGRGAQYEWHVDSNPVTGVLFATDCGVGFGGSLVFRGTDGRRAIYRPRAGKFICFDAREIPHRVTPLRHNGVRISLPMNYYESATEQPRPEDLDSQIYSPADQ